MAIWRKDPMLGVILVWTALLAGVLVWLPLVRGATQGAAYSWALADGIGGRGIGGDYWMLVLGAIPVFFLLYLGWRGGRQPFHWLLLAFHVPLATAVVFAAWSNPHRFRWEGATIGVNVSLAVIGPVIFGGLAIAVIFWVVRDLSVRQPRTLVFWVWTRATRARLALVVAFLPLELVLFRSGGIRSVQNVIGVFLVGYQWFLINFAFARAAAGPTSSGESPGAKPA